jgi:ATP-dependent DNA helicase RecG
LGHFQDPITIKDTARTKSDVITQIEEVLDFIKKHINLEVIITGAPHNIQKWQYPMEALREIVTNMIVHRDYRASADSIVKIYPNKIEFYNPGHLPDEIPVSKLLSGNYKSSPRNKLLSGVFKDMGLMEKYGSGIGRIINYFKEANLPLPVFENIQEGFCVTIFGENKDLENENKDLENENKDLENENKDLENESKDLENENKDLENKLSEIQIKIVHEIKTNPFITQKELKKIIGINEKNIRNNMRKLKNIGILQRIGPDKGGYWTIIDNPNN